jgi:glycolate oxidase iron-sulfur subunit
MHLVDHARAYIEKTYQRPAAERFLRRLLSVVLPYPGRFRLALIGASLARPFARLVPGASPMAERMRAMLRLAPAHVPSPSAIERRGVFPAQGERRGRVGLLTGCAQQVLAPSINEATIRLLTRMGIEVVVTKGQGCCGALDHHMGYHDPAMRLARANIAAWSAEIDGEGLDAIVVNASGCGTTLKDYGFMFREDRDLAAAAARVSSLARDVSELVAELGLGAAAAPEKLTLAYHSACSLQHGQKITTLPRTLLAKAGFVVRDVPEGHLCCGSAGTYNLLQPEIAGQLKARKLANIARVAPDAIAAGNIGCMTQIASGTGTPVLHTVELLDWATGGPRPEGLRAGG